MFSSITVSLIDDACAQYFPRLSIIIEGTSEYTTCAGLLTTSSSTWPESALFQIAANGVALDKLVIGKPGISSDASNGFIDPSTLAGCVEQAKNQGWDAGVMVWEVRSLFTLSANKSLWSDTIC